MEPSGESLSDEIRFPSPKNLKKRLKRLAPLLKYAQSGPQKPYEALALDIVTQFLEAEEKKHNLPALNGPVRRKS